MGIKRKADDVEGAPQTRGAKVGAKKAKKVVKSKKVEKSKNVEKEGSNGGPPPIFQKPTSKKKTKKNPSVGKASSPQKKMAASKGLKNVDKHLKKVEKAEGSKKVDKPMSSKEKRENQKKLKEKRKKMASSSTLSSSTSSYELGLKAKKIWEKLRNKKASKMSTKDDEEIEDKAKMAAELHGLIKGNVAKLIYAHDTVRVVECLVALGGPEVLDSLFRELQGDLVSLAKSKYASFFVQKLLKYGTKEQRSRVMGSFEGKVAELTRHKVANAVVETCFNEVADAPWRSRMLQEFLGPEFRLCKDETWPRTVVDLVKNKDHAAKEKSVTRDLRENCNILLTKGCYNVSIVHTVLYNQMLLLNHQIKGDKVQDAEKARAEFVAQLRDVCVHVLHSQDGARLAMNALWHGSAKDRKAILKSFKTFVPKICSEDHGHLVLLAAFDCVDDTKLLTKAIVNEILFKGDDDEKNKEVLLGSEQARKVLTYLLVGRDTTHFHPDYLKLLQQGDGNEASKKDEATRRKELRMAVAPGLFRHFAQDQNLAQFLQTDRKNCLFIQALLCHPQADKEDDKEDIEDEKLRLAVASKLAQLVASSMEGQKNPEEDNLVESPAGHRLLKKVILCDKTKGSSKVPVLFSELLMQELAKTPGSVVNCLKCNRGAFLFVAVAETEVPRLKQQLKDLLKDHHQLLQSQTTAGANILKTKL